MPTRRPVKLPGAGGHGDTVEIGEFHLGEIHHARKQRHHGFGVTARHRNALAGGDPTAIGIEDGGRAGFERRIDGEDAHGLTSAAVIRVSGRSL